MGAHILVPLDGSNPSWEALDHAAAGADGDRITVLHVVDPAEGIYAGAEGSYYDAQGFERALERGEELGERARDRLAEDGALDRLDLETTVETGKAARTIVRYADEHEVDRIVIGSHGRSGVSRILLGSVAETVVRRAPCPVTVVR